MATGHFPRRRIRPGYLACKICDRDLPEEEFRLFKRFYGGKDRYYRNSYCRACESTYNTEVEKVKRRSDPAYRERVNKRAMVRYRYSRRRARMEEVAWTKRHVRQSLGALTAAGYSFYRIQHLTGIKRDTLARWNEGKGNPTVQKALALRKLVEELEKLEVLAA